jgi:hypothetical protein
LQEVCIAIAQSGEWNTQRIAAMDFVTESFLMLWSEHKHHLKQLQEEKDLAFRFQPMPY